MPLTCHPYMPLTCHPSRFREKAYRVLSVQCAALSRAQLFDVLLQYAEGARIVLHEIHGACTARQRLEPERTASREQVQHARIRQTRMHHAHPRLAHAVERGPHGIALWRRDPTAAPLARDDPHRKSTRPSWSVDRPRNSLRSSLDRKSAGWVTSACSKGP